MNRLSIRHIVIAASMFIACVPSSAQRDVIRAGVDLVVVPTAVRDHSGKFVYDLTKDDFVVLEDGRPQEIRSLSNDPMPLSVAVLIDTGVGKIALDRVAKSIVSLSSAFAEDDEAELYRFDHIVMKLSDFTNSHQDLEKSLAIIKGIAERKYNDATPPIIMPGRGPHWLRFLLGDGSIEFRDLNDPIFTSAVELEARPAERRKVILVVSDGQVADDWNPLVHESSIVHSFKETEDRLVQRQIQMYGIAVGNALAEGTTSILHAYADATGGDVYRGATQSAMETAFPKITEQARHQYVLSYVSNNKVPGTVAVTRKIEVKVRRPDLRVSHRKSYLQYPPPQ